MNKNERGSDIVLSAFFRACPRLTLRREKLFRVCIGFPIAGDSRRVAGSHGKHSSYPERDDD